MGQEKTYSFLEAKAKLESLCAYQERCQFELENRLILWKIDKKDRDRLLAHLITNNFLNEERFAEAYVSGKVNIKKWGRIKIRLHLRKKHVSEYSIDKGLSSIDKDNYLANLNHLAHKKLDGLVNEQNNYVRKMKVFKYLQSKGYERDLFDEISDERIN